MGCGGSKENGTVDANGAVPFNRRPKISVRIGPQAKKLDNSPGCVFIFGGPGSRKGRIVDDLVNSYDFQLICGEDVIFQDLPKKVSNVIKLETIKEIKNFIEDDPSHITLPWLLSCVERRVEMGRSTGQTFLIDIIPNLRYLLKIDGISEDNLSALEAFEQKYPISFGLNLAIPVDKVLNAKSNYCATPEGKDSKMKEGGQSDEADSGRTQKRAALYNSCAQPFLNYLAKSERLVTVDVACGVADLIWHQVHDVMMDLDFHPNNAVNTVVLIGWTDEDVSDIAVDKYQMKQSLLRDLVEDPLAEPKTLLLELRKYVDNMSRETDSFVISMQDTKIANMVELQEVPNRPITFLEVQEGYLETYLPGAPKSWKPSPSSRRYKAVCTLENEAFLFPPTTADKTAIDIATQMASTKGT